MPQDSTPRRPRTGDDRPFWQRKTLTEMTEAEWESLCDGCGRCCLVKLEDIDTGELAYTDVVCRLLDTDRCRCTQYPRRHELVPDCVAFTAETIGDLDWMPPTCAYRLLAEGRDLYWWHPLVSGDPQSVHAAGISVRGRVRSEVGIDTGDLEDFVVDWPTRSDDD